MVTEGSVGDCSMPSTLVIVRVLISPHGVQRDTLVECSHG